MASLFDDLPAPKAQNAEEEEQQHASHEEEEEEDEERPGKRPRTEPDAAEEREQQHTDGDADADGDAPGGGGAPPPPAAPADQVGPALRKIANHISNAAKFPKAAGLLRQLIASGAITPDHRAELFGALRAAYAHPARADDPSLRREYRRLLNAFCNGVPPDVLSPGQGAHLEVYSVWTLQRGELATDDSFVFNKAIARLKDDIAALGPVSAAEEAAARGLELPGGARLAQAVPEGGAQPAPAAAPEPPAADEEADPFGLDEVMRRNDEEQQREAAAGEGEAQAQEEDDGSWTAAELGVMRRQALLDCVTAAKGMHKLAWARTSVEMLIEAAHRHLDHFATPQRAALDGYLRWVKAERDARRSGAARGVAGSKELTSFEKARAEWANAAVSRYGKVGAGGDSKAAHWLG